MSTIYHTKYKLPKYKLHTNYYVTKSKQVLITLLYIIKTIYQIVLHTHKIISKTLT